MKHHLKDSLREMRGSSMRRLTIKNPKSLAIKISTIFIPVFSIATITQSMVYVLPALAVGVLLGANINQNDKKDSSDVDDGVDPSDS